MPRNPATIAPVPFTLSMGGIVDVAGFGTVIGPPVNLSVPQKGVRPKRLTAS